jgi:hypothetical protein
VFPAPASMVKGRAGEDRQALFRDASAPLLVSLILNQEGRFYNGRVTEKAGTRGLTGAEIAKRHGLKPSSSAGGLFGNRLNQSFCKACSIHIPLEMPYIHHMVESWSAFISTRRLGGINSKPCPL